MIPTDTIFLRTLPDPVAHRIRVMAAERRCSYGALVGQAIALMDGKRACPGCGVLIEAQDHTQYCKTGEPKLT